jgi:nicotinate-nucleotide pyrophosphorylase (carboxylating)
MNCRKLVELALDEDIGTGDITTEYLDLPMRNSVVFIIAKADGILCGIDVAFTAFHIVDEHIKCIAYKKDGDKLKKGDTIAKLEGYSSSILSAERVALNFLQRLSGIATLTHTLVEKLTGTKTKLLDTRKTTPLLRNLEKYAVRIGGGYNHRFGLYDMILIKENHIRAAGSITKAIQLVQQKNNSYRVEIEVTNLEELDEAIKNGVDRIMLDNMSIEQMTAAVVKYNGQVEFEASGNVSIETIERVASTGVDYISTGSITHSVSAFDISLLFQEDK